MYNKAPAKQLAKSSALASITSVGKCKHRPLGHILAVRLRVVCGRGACLALGVANASVLLTIKSVNSQFHLLCKDMWMRHLADS